MKEQNIVPEQLAERLNEILKADDIILYRETLKNYYPADLAEALSCLPLERIIIALRIMPTEDLAEIFPHFNNEIQEEIIESYTSVEIKELFDQIFTDDIVEILEELPSNIVEKILRATTPESRLLINSILKYNVNTAGSIMSVDYTSLKINWTVKEAINIIKKERDEAEEVHYFFVVDDLNNLKGVVELKTLFFSKNEALIEDIMDDRYIYANTKTDQEEVANMFKKYDITTLPIINSQNKLVGIITVDDILDVLEEEATEDIHIMAGINPTEDEYFKTSVFKMVKSRIIWLLLLMVSATITQVIILVFMNLYGVTKETASFDIGNNNFSISYVMAILLTPLLTVISGTTGNASNQSSTMIVRALSLKEVEPKDYWRILWKELRVSTTLGLILVAINFVRMIAIYAVEFKGNINQRELWYAIATLSISMFLAIVFSKVIGATFPLLAQKMKIDPAITAGPLLTTIIDAISTAIFFGIGMIFFFVVL
ncbi:magnesium transporter [Spiroplasma tabanidicola]|uniref:Magnesium transporter MgtE n=1 Tax=Spiroplasma tabanidicola TaxID=324079 RepID=A0A6I6C5X6_9MOLU|nr:magnesium transporter [Spiroplasma tabanidicola]QGS51540.1 Mg2+ transport protein [Spiroplasma tabanidicola]